MKKMFSHLVIYQITEYRLQNPIKVYENHGINPQRKKKSHFLGLY